MVVLNLSDFFSSIKVDDFLRTRVTQNENLLRREFFRQTSLRPKEFASTYEIIKSPGSSSYYIILAKGKPIFLLEIHEAKKIDISLYYKALPEDYCLTIFIAESIRQDKDLQFYTLMACIQALFGQAGISRLIAPVYGSNAPEILEPLLAKAGFTFLRKRRIAHPDLFIFGK